MSLVVRRDEFRAMGCAVQLELVGDDESDVVTGLAFARDSISNLELLWSRFLPDSDISRLNGAKGAMVDVDSATIELLHAMVQGFAATDGCFDPTLLAPLVELGYDASWSDPLLITSLPAGVSWRGGISGIAVDAIASVAQLPSGTVLDAGGIGKGMAADMVVSQLLRSGIAGAMISIGGDLRVAGVGPHNGGWVIGVGDAFAPTDSTSEMLSLSLANAGVATSGTMRRAWRDPNGASVHHLLDPATCRPIQEAIQATVVAGTAAWAEVFTKMLMVRGISPLEHLDSLGLGARVVLADRSVHCNDAWHSLELQCIRS
jgi:thiamine biosynthesis lipoprotein